MPLQIRRGTNAERAAMTQPLASGELLYVTDDQRLYIGNGTTLGGVQITGYTDGDAKDAAAAIFTGGIHNGITFTYNTVGNTISANVDLSSYTGLIDADFKGSVFADNSTLLVDGVSGTINLDGTVKGNIIPDADQAYDLGSASYRFRDLYLSGSSIKLGAATITASGSAVNLPAGSTVNGVLIGTGSGEGVITGSNYNISIVADDSSFMVNTSTKVITAAGGFVGDITGDVYSSDIYSDDGLLGIRLYTATGNDVSNNFYGGTRISPTSLSPGDNIGTITIKGWNGTDYALGAGIYAAFDATANLASANPASSLGLVVGDNSNAVIATFDKTGTFSAPVMKVGSYTSSPDNRPTGSIGMIIYNTTTNKFQGYANTGWVDLS